MPSHFISLTLLNGLTYGALLFVVASGLTLVFGLMRVINLAHGALYLVGGYVGYSITRYLGSFWLAVLVSGVSMTVLGYLIHSQLLQRVRGQDLRLILLTIGIAFILGDGSLIIWGGNPLQLPIPKLLKGSLSLGGLDYPRYRLFVLAMAVLIAVGLWLLQSRTRVGAYIRAGVDDSEMLGALGVDVRLVFVGVFMLGAFLAGAGGVIGGAFLTLYPGAEWEMLVSTLVVIIIGGMGSLGGAVVGAIVVGLIDSIGQSLLPELSYFLLFGPMALLLVFRPQGLFGRAT